MSRRVSFGVAHAAAVLTLTLAAACGDDSNGTGGPPECVAADDCSSIDECSPAACVEGECTTAPLEDDTPCTGGICQGGLCAPRFACTEQGVRDAIAEGGGPHLFACDGPTTILTEAEILIDNDVILDGEGELTLDGSESHRVFDMAQSIAAELVGFTIQRGLAVAGGGIANRGGTLTLRRTTLTNNEATGSGGGVTNDAALSLIDCTVSGNRANTGGGIVSGGPLTVENTSVSGNEAELGGGLFNNGPLTLENSTISDNRAMSGGGIHNTYGDGLASIAGTTLADNLADIGGGIFNDEGSELVLRGVTISGSTSVGVLNQGGTVTLSDQSTVSDCDVGLTNADGTVTILDSTITGNGPRGGVFNSGTMTIERSLLSGNEGSELLGGGVTHSEGTLSITESTLDGNRASSGAGVLNQAELRITRCTFSDNSAEVFGGGLTNVGTASVTNSTFSGNRSAVGGAIANVSTGLGTSVSIRNSTLANNSAPSSSAITATGDGIVTLLNTLILGNCLGPSGTIVSNGGNIESPSVTCSLTDPSDEFNVTAQELALEPLGANGGPTETHAIGPMSIARDFIPEANCDDEDGAPLATDQRGEARPASGEVRCDAGAFEVQ